MTYPDTIDHEATARARKALKLYHLITSRNVRGDASPAGLLAVIEAWTETEWASASILTGTRPASAATRAVVIGMLRDDCEGA